LNGGAIVVNQKRVIIPSKVHLIPFQKERKEEDPSLDLQDFNIKSTSQNLTTHCPAANTLLAFPLLTSIAEIGPGISEPAPTEVHVALLKVY
jgi:hypothetical protein